MCPKQHAKLSLCAAGAGNRYCDSLLYTQMVEAVQVGKHLPNLCFAANLESFFLRGWSQAETCMGLLRSMGLLWAISVLWPTPNMCQYRPTWACTGLLWDACLAEARHLPSIIISPMVLLQGISGAKCAERWIELR